MKSSVETIIVGAGPAGMAAAMELAKAGKDFLMLEKEATVGGLSKTYTIQEGDLVFRTDNGPHRFFSKNKYLYDFISEVLHDDWILVDRHTQQFIRGKFYDYPINALQVVRNVGPWYVLKIIADYSWAKIVYGLLRKQEKTFTDSAHAKFGKTLANFNILNYTEKIWGLSTDELDSEWARQRISGLNVTEVVATLFRKVFGTRTSSAKSLVDQFYYPKFGTGEIYETIRLDLVHRGYQISTNVSVIKVKHENGRVVSVVYDVGGQSQEVSCNFLVESVHITDFVHLLDPLPPEAVLSAARALQFRSQVHLFITLDRPQVTQNQWIYFPDRGVLFARISEMKNFSSEMAPPGKTSLFVEFFCEEGDRIYNASKEELLVMTIPVLEQYGFIKKEEVRNAYVFRGGKDYPVYTTEYKDHLSILKNYLDSFSNLFYIGRPGRFKYTNQDHSLEMGILAAKGIVENRRVDVESVGGEQDYFEKGFVPKKS